jgi:hypothetical protein
MNCRSTEPFDHELEEAFDYYEMVRPGLGLDLLVEFRRSLTRIIENPYAWQVFHKADRRALLRRFPYAVVYRVVENEILVVAFWHMKRKAGYWNP